MRKKIKLTAPLLKSPGSKDRFKSLGSEVTISISDYLPPKDAVSLGSSCTLFREDLQKNLGKRKANYINQLIEHVVKGDFAQVKIILRNDPQLLLEKGLAKDYSGRQIEGTAFQAALGAEDTEMCEWMADCFNRLRDRNGREEMLKQYHAQFPALGEEKEDSAEESPDIAQLHEIVRVIGASNNDQECEDALQKFRDYLRPQGVIRTGKHFNAELLLRAFQLSDENYNLFGGFESRKNNLFYGKVIGYLQRFLPACYAQAICQGFYSHIVLGAPLERSLKFRFNSGSFFFPLPLEPTGLGYDGAVGHQTGWTWIFQTFCQTKTAALQNLCADSRPIPIQNSSAAQ